MRACFRRRVIAFFLGRKLLNERPAKNMVEWTHSGFSVGERGTHAVVYRASYND